MSGYETQLNTEARKGSALRDFLAHGALKIIHDDIHERSNPRNEELTGGATIAVMSALIGQSYNMTVGNWDNRANTQVVLLAGSGAGKDAPIAYHEKVVSEIYSSKCYVSTYNSPTVVQHPLKSYGYCFDSKDEAGDLLKAMKSNGGNSASGSIAPMIKTLATRASGNYLGFSQSQLTENPLSFYCVNPFYSAFSIASPAQFMEATSGSDIEGGYWGRVILLHVEKVATPINPRLIPVPEAKFSREAAKVIDHFKLLIAPRRKAWEEADDDKDKEYSTQAKPQQVIYQHEASDYLHEVHTAYLHEEKQRDDYEQIRPIAQRLGEIASKLLLLYTVSKYYDHPGKAPIADIEGAKICWALALELHLEKLRLLKLNAETDYDKVIGYATEKCKDGDVLTKGALTQFCRRTLANKVKANEALEWIGESDLFDLLPPTMAAKSIRLR